MKKPLKLYRFNVSVWTRGLNLKLKRVQIEARNESEADNKINKRYKKAYDIERLTNDDDDSDIDLRYT